MARLVKPTVAVHLVWGALCLICIAVLAFVAVRSRGRIRSLQAELAAFEPELHRFEARARHVGRLERDLADISSNLDLVNNARALLRSPEDTMALRLAQDAVRHACVRLAECVTRRPVWRELDELPWMPAAAALFALDQEFRLQGSIEPLAELYDSLLPWALAPPEVPRLSQAALRVQVLRGSAERALRLGDPEEAARLQGLAEHHRRDVVEVQLRVDGRQR